MKKIKCIDDIRELELNHSVPTELLDQLYSDMEAIYEWSDPDHTVTLDEFHTDDYDYGYIALLEGTENKADLEQEIGLTGGLENTIPEGVTNYHWGSDKWSRVVVIYNDSYSMLLWVRNYDGYDSYADEFTDQAAYDASQTASAPPF